MIWDPRRRRIRDEIEHHLAELEAELRAEGLSPAEARREATRRFGDPKHVAVEARRSGGRGDARLAWDRARQDLRFAVRQLVRRPLVGALTVATIVAGVVTTTVVFSVVHAVVLDALPFPETERMVRVNQTSPQGRLYGISEPNFVDFRARQRSFVHMTGFLPVTPLLTDAAGEVEPVEGVRVSHDFFPLFGLVPLQGRVFTASEDTYGSSADVVVLAEGAWRRRFGGDPELVGRTIVLDGAPRRVIGVVPSDRGWPGLEVFAPLAPHPDAFRDDQRMTAYARLAPGVELAAARRDLSAVAARLSDEYPESNDRWGAAVDPLRDALVGERLTALGHLLLAAVGLSLLLACASVSNLLLARATARGQEMSVRVALGAARGRITAQLLTEGALLAALGAALSLALARPALRIVQALGPGDLGRLGVASLDGPVLLVAVGAAVLTVLVAGVAPGVLLVRSGAFGALRTGDKLAGDPGRRVRDALTVTQFALALTVLLGAGLLTRSFVALQSVELGFEPEGLVRFNVRLPNASYTQALRGQYLRRLEAEVAALPGVAAVGSTTASPFSGSRPSNFVARADREPDRQEDFIPVSWRAVSGGYFGAVGIPVLAGRVFGPEDELQPGQERPRNPPVVIDETLAGILWPDGTSPVGRLVTWFLPGGRRYVVIGVVATARDERLDDRIRPRIYRPFTYTSWEEPTVLVRAAGDAGRLIPVLRRTVRSLDPAVPAISLGPVTGDVRSSSAWPRFTMQVLVAFAAIALVLASMGVYGVSAYGVSRRRRELGLRVALGADPGAVHWTVVRRALRLAGVGLAAGLAISYATAGLLGSLLYEVQPLDPLTFVLVPAALALVAAVSAWLPARRAVGMDAAAALGAD